jgi:hypothetical protein
MSSPQHPLAEFLIGPRTGAPKALVEMLPELRKRLREAEEHAQAALAEVEGLRKVVEGVEQIAAGVSSANPLPLFVEDQGAGTDNGTPAPEPSPRGQEAVRLILEERWPNVVTQALIFTEVMRRGWIDPTAKTPRAAVRAAAQRLAAAGHAEKVGSGFKYKPPSEQDEGG